MENIFKVISTSTVETRNPLLFVLGGDYVEHVCLNMVITRKYGNETITRETIELESCSDWNTSCIPNDIIHMKMSTIQRDITCQK